MPNDHSNDSASDPALSAPNSVRSNTILLLLGMLFGVLALAFAGALMLSQSSGRALLSRGLSAATGRTVTIDVSQPAVVDRIQRLQRLETVIYTVDKLVTGAKENPLLPDFLTGDRLLMMVHGEVVAGIDFSNLKAADVQVDGKRIHLHLPAAQLFSTRLDSARTRVYSRQTGLLVPTDPNLETHVRQEAELQMQQAALADGILRIAQQNAGSTISSLLQGLGFETVDFN
jgi:hypothetical protein